MGHAPVSWILAPLLGFGLVLLAASPAIAQNQGLVVRDGTLGSDPAGVVAPGLDDLGQRADYLIRADLGEQRGGVGGVHLDDSRELLAIGLGADLASWVNLAGQLTPLPTSYLDAASLMRERCAARRSGERAGSFAVSGNGGIPAEPDGWLPASMSSTVPASVLSASSTSNTSDSAGSGPSLVLAGSCR